MASWRERYAWWREFHYLGAADVKRRMEHVIWAQEKRREAEHFLWWHANWLKVLGMVIATLGAALPSAPLVGLVGGTGAAIGEITGYMAGYSGRGIAQRSKMYERVEGWMRRWGALTILIMSVVPFIFDLAGIAAGVLRFSFWKFLLLCWLGRTILYIGVALAGAWGWEAVLP